MNLVFKIKCCIFALTLFLLHVEEAKGIAINAMPLTMPQHPMRHFCFMNDKKIECIKDYLGGMNYTNAAKSNDTSAYFVKKWLKEEGVKLRPAARKPRLYTLNEDCFSSKTPESNYWAGFLAADGSIGKCNSVNLTIQQRDIKHLELYRDFIGSNAPFYHFEKHNTNKVELYSKKIVADLSVYGVRKDKTRNYVVPDFIKFDVDFWRGMIDGDGHISLKNTNTTNNFPIIGLCGTIDACNSFREFCLTIHPFKARVNKHGSIFDIRIGGVAAIKIISEIYGNNPRIALNRKYEKAMSII